MIAAIVFAISVCVSMVLCTLVWELYVADSLYHCTDRVGLDFIAGPDHWVHGRAAGEPGDFGDTIAPGWSLRGLKALWVGFISLSLAMSWLLAHLTYLYAVRSASGRSASGTETGSVYKADS